MLGWLWMLFGLVGAAFGLLLAAPFALIGMLWGGFRPFTVLVAVLAAYLLGRRRGTREATAARAP